MLGYQLIIVWFILFFSIFYPFVYKLNSINKTIAYWCYCMIFITIFEFMLIFHYKYMCKKGEEYYNENKCFGYEERNIKDMFSYKMYMDLYGDYSLSDSKYRKNIGKDGFHFVLFGEIWHGIFSGILAITSLYYLYTKEDSKELFLSIFTMGIIQLTMIIWYVSPVFLELFIEESDNYISKWWWAPFLWNVPWFIFPPIMIYHGAKNLLISE